MALKRLDEEFELKPGTQLLPYMKRLLPSLEGRFQSLEAERKTFDMAVEDMRAVALMRINEILIPATEAITEVTSLGFLLAPSSSSALLELGLKTFIVDEGPQRDTFTPSPYLIVERVSSIDDYAIARLIEYNQETGGLYVDITAWHGNPGPWDDWMISSTPGMADSTKLYHDAIGPLHDQVVIDAAQVAADRVAVQNAADALFAAGLDAQSFIRKDGAVNFLAVQRGVAPANSANDTALVTAAWTRARMIEYAGDALMKSGGTMTGPLYLSGAPAAANQAATKAYADQVVGSGHWVNDYLGIRGPGPALLLQSTGTQQSRYIQSNSAAGVVRWQLFMADWGLESGGDAGSNFYLHRFNDGGAGLGPALHISRQTAVVTIYNRLDINAGGAQITGNLNNAGDAWTYRGDNTGVLWMGNQRTARIYWNGGTWDLAPGGLSIGGNQLTSGHINCYSIYTQGHAITTWGLTSHGNITVNGTIYTLHNLRLGGGLNYSEIEFYDNDWGPMWVHHNQDLIGFLNNGRGWLAYFTNAGHLWTAQYGWIHDYVNGTASNYAWNVGNYYWGHANGTFVRETRKPYAGDPHAPSNPNTVWEPYWGAVMTGWLWWTGQSSPAHYRLRYDQVNINGNWYTTRYD